MNLIHPVQNEKSGKTKETTIKKKNIIFISAGDRKKEGSFWYFILDNALEVISTSCHPWHI